MKHQNSSKLYIRTKAIKSQKDDSNLHKNSVQIIQQNEPPSKNSSKIEDILNHPVLKRRLPPLDKNNPEKNDEDSYINIMKKSKNLQEEINYNIEKLKKSEIKKESKEIEDNVKSNKDCINANYKILDNIITKQQNKKEQKINQNKIEKNLNNRENKAKNDTCAGTSSYQINIQDLKDEINNKIKIILKLSDEQNDYKEQLNTLLIKLNALIVEHSDFLYKEEAEMEEFGEGKDNVYELSFQLEQKQKNLNLTKNKKKILKQQYELLNNKEKNMSNDNIEKSIQKIKKENDDLFNQIKLLKSKSKLEEKKIRNGKNFDDINKVMNELTVVENKKHESFKKYSTNCKLIETCIKEFENLQKIYLDKKQNVNYFNAKIEEEINRLKDDLTPNKAEIIKRIENDTAFIIKKMLHNEKLRENIFKAQIPYKPKDSQKMKGLKKRTSLEHINKIKLNRTNYSGKHRKINIYAKDIKDNKDNKILMNNNINIKKEKNDVEIKSDKNYDELTDFEYREMLNKKDYCYDIVTKLEKSAKEAQKMYQRKIRDINIVIEKNENRLKSKKNENALLKIEIDNLSKLLAITEEEHKLINEHNITHLKDNNKNIKNATLTLQTEKELESQKEYLSPEYFQSENNNNINHRIKKEKSAVQTITNTDVTRNEILNELKTLNSQNLDDPIQDSEITRKNKLNNLTMKFPDLSNIEENVNSSNLNNEEERNKILEDIKKKYNINSNDIKSDSNLEKNKNYLEHENALDEKIDEKNENDLYGDDNDENKIKYEYKDNNDKNINNENEEIIKIEQFEEDSLGEEGNNDNEY